MTLSINVNIPPPTTTTFADLYPGTLYFDFGEVMSVHRLKMKLKGAGAVCPVHGFVWLVSGSVGESDPGTHVVVVQGSLEVRRVRLRRRQAETASKSTRVQIAEGLEREAKRIEQQAHRDGDGSAYIKASTLYQYAEEIKANARWMSDE